MNRAKTLWACAGVLSLLGVAAVMLSQNSAEAYQVNANRIDQVQMLTGEDTRGQKVMFLLDGVQEKLVVYQYAPRNVNNAKLVLKAGTEMHKVFQVKPSNVRSNYMMVSEKMLGESGPSIVMVYETTSGQVASFCFDGNRLQLIGVPRSVRKDLGLKVR